MSFIAQGPSAVSTTFTYATGAAEANLYDGNDATSAADPGGLTASTKAAFDLGSALQIVRCRVITAAANGFSNAATFNIEYSDTSLTAGFTTASTITISAGTGQVSIKEFASVGPHRYWRISYASGTTGGNAWLGELTFYINEVAQTGAFSETGHAARFSLAVPGAAGGYSFTGKAALFAPKLASSAAAYSVSGMATASRSNFAAATSVYAVTGNGALFKSRLVSEAGAFALTGNVVATLQSWSLSGSAYIVTGIDAAFSRDFNAWVPRPFDADTWAAKAPAANAWTPAAVPSSTWTAE